MKPVCLILALVACFAVLLDARPRAVALLPPPDVEFGNVLARNIDVRDELSAGALIGPHWPPVEEFLTDGVIGSRFCVIGLTSPTPITVSIGPFANDGVQKTIVATEGAGHLLLFPLANLRDGSGAQRSKVRFAGPGSVLRIVNLVDDWHVESARGVVFE